MVYCRLVEVKSQLICESSTLTSIPWSFRRILGTPDMKIQGPFYNQAAGDFVNDERTKIQTIFLGTERI